MKNKKNIIILIFGVLIFFACVENNKTESNENQDSLDFLQAKPKTNIFYSLPSPMEMVSIISRTGVNYNESFLSDTKEAERYSTNRALALNLGIYGADLSYACLFDQQQKSLEYMAAVKKLANELDVLGSFNDEKIKQIEENIHDKEALMETISETFFKSDAYLKENDRREVAAIIVLGGWIESLYIAMQLSEKSIEMNKELVDRIIDQRLSLETIISLLQQYKQNKDVNALLEDVNSLKKIYDEIVILEVIEKKDPDSGKIVKQNIEKMNLTPDNFIKLYNKVIEIRTNYIQLF